MANYATLKAAIAAAIKQNGNNEITGILLQQQLLAMVNSLGVGYQFAGIATPSTNPGTPDQNVFYFAGTPGVYSNFDTISVGMSELAVLIWNGEWTKQAVTLNNGGDLIAYFQQSLRPKFSVTPGSGVTTVVLPASNLKIYDVFGNNLYTISNSVEHSLELSGYGEIVYDVDDGQFKAVTLGTTGNFLLLVGKTNNGINGMLAKFYYEQVFEDYRGTAECYIYWQNAGQPTFSISGTTVTIQFPDSNFHIYQKDGGMAYQSQTSGRNQSFTIPINNCLIFDKSDNTVKVSGLGTNYPSGAYILFSNILGKAFTGLLEPYYNIRSNDAAKYAVGLKAYFGGGVKPQIHRTSVGGAYSVVLPTTGGSLQIYSRNDELVESISYTAWSSSQPFTVDISHTLVWNISTRVVETINLAVSGDYIILLSSAYGALSGLLAPYFEEKINDIGLSLYFVGLTHPDFYVDGTTICVRCPDNGMRIYSKDDGIIDTYTGSVNQTYNIPNLYKFVFDKNDRNLKVVENTTTGAFIELLTNNNMVVSGLLEPWFTQYQNSINKLYNTQHERLIMQNINRRNIVNETQQGGFYPLVLLHFSDIHQDVENLRRILHFHTIFKSEITDILNTGDTVNVYTNGYTWYVDIPGTDKILTAIGNHDVSDTGGAEHAGPDVYNMEIAPFVADWGVVQPANAAINGLCYYYKDYTDANVRLIVLDNFAPGMAAQVTWLQNVLADAKTQGLCVVCAAHFPCNMDLQKDNHFCSPDGVGTFTYAMQSEFISAVDAFITSGGKFACWLTGHTHANMFGTVKNYPAQLCVNIASASDARNSETMARVDGTQSQDCFNIISVDENTKCLKIHRIGANVDRYLRHIGSMCINYETKELIYND